MYAWSLGKNNLQKHMSAKQATQSIFICNFLFRLKDFLRTDSKTDSGATKNTYLNNFEILF